MSEPELLAVGRIGPALGTKGDVFVEPWTDDPGSRFAAGIVLSTVPESAGPLSVESSRLHTGKLVVHFAGFEDRNAVEALRGVQLTMPATARPPLSDPEEFYDTDLIGLRARDVGGVEFGTVKDLLHIGSAVYLEIVVDGVDRLVPFVAAIVPEIHVDDGYLVIAPPDGLFEL